MEEKERETGERIHHQASSTAPGTESEEKYSGDEEEGVVGVVVIPREEETDEGAVFHQSQFS